MIARMIKAYMKNPKVRKHRDHRSKKGRRSIYGKEFAIKRKKDLENIKIKELEHESK